MNPLGYFVMVVWVPIVLYLFSRLPVQRALIVSFLAGWLFLPEASIPLAGIPDINKVSLTCYGILIATALFDFQRFREFRMHWVDAPMLVWCLCPAVSSLTNGLGPYDGFASALAQTVTWGFPYFLGRLYLGSFRGLQQLAIAIVLGGLIYIPLCLFEIRMSPQLHFWLYGFYPQSFDQAIRYGGFRPIVFMQHGLMVGVWMMTATLLAFGFWRIGALAGLLQQFVQGIGDRSQRTTGQTVAPEGLVGPSLGIFLGLLATFVLVKSTGAYFLLALGIVLFLTMRWSRTALPLLLIVGVMCAYLGFASGGGMTPQAMEQISATATQLTTADRAASLTFRLKNEALLSA
ncbi:MAG TPA: O-antigen ligase domain-containing protein, partial [Stenomitos sp.]